MAEERSIQSERERFTEAVAIANVFHMTRSADLDEFITG